MISGVRGKKSRHKSALMQPLSLVDLIVSNSNKSGLQRITEINLLQPYTDIPYNVMKSSIVLFLNEILYKVLKEEQGDAVLFQFIKNALIVLDLKQDSCSSFHIYFLIQLSAYLGFTPQGKRTEQQVLFDLREGCFTANLPSHMHYLSADNSRIFFELLNSRFENFQLIPISRLQRKELLQGMILYYQLHIAGFGELKSLSVLEAIAAP
jgi:DNA repair protein RecO (recombination protein O)